MLVAEINGKIASEVLNYEDYLTSAVFGHLRYIPPCSFWQSLFFHARDSTDAEHRLSEVLAGRSLSLANYSRLEIDFWPSITDVGEPDMILEFSGSGVPRLKIVVEVKLESGKHGTGDHDQLARYMNIVGETNQEGFACLLYLTPRESLAEINDTVESKPELESERVRIFRLQWQDVLIAAKREAHRAKEPGKTILSEVAAFLHRRGLEYFDGFCVLDELPELRDRDGAYYEPKAESANVFCGMATVESLKHFAIEQGAWINE